MNSLVQSHSFGLALHPTRAARRPPSRGAKLELKRMGELLPLYHRLNDPTAQREAEAALIVQRRFRCCMAMWRFCGPTALVSRADDSLAGFGLVSYPHADRRAQFLLVSDTSAPRALAAVVRHHWRLPKPEIIVAVGGSARDFDMPLELHEAFNAGLEKLISFAQVILTTGGTNAGVMKLVGQTVARFAAPCPLIGVMSKGATNDHETFEGVHGGTVTYAPREARKGVADLDPNHTHVLMYDTVKTGENYFGMEIAPRARFERVLAESQGAILINVILQGGPGTFAIIENALMERTPVVLLEGSGGACDAVAEFKTKPTEATVRKWTANLSDEKVQEVLKSCHMIIKLNRQHGEKLLHFFRADQGADLSQVLLQALIASLRTLETTDTDGKSRTPSVVQRAKPAMQRIERAVRVSIAWGRIDSCAELLQQYGNKPASSFGDMTVLDLALQYALENQSVQTVRYLALKHKVFYGTGLRRVRMCRLFTEAADKFSFVSSAAEFQRLLTTPLGRNSSTNEAAGGMSAAEYKLYVKAVEGLLTANNLPQLSRYFASSRAMRLERVESVFAEPRDVFIWAVGTPPSEPRASKDEPFRSLPAPSETASPFGAGSPVHAHPSHPAWHRRHANTAWRRCCSATVTLFGPSGPIQRGRCRMPYSRPTCSAV